MTSGVSPKLNGPDKSLSSAVNESDDLVFTITLPKVLPQAWPGVVLVSNPKALELTPNSMKVSAP